MPKKLEASSASNEKVEKTSYLDDPAKFQWTSFTRGSEAFRKTVSHGIVMMEREIDRMA